MAKAKEKGAESKVEEINFRCRVCEKSKPLGEMVVVTRYFPPIAICRDCEKKMR